jgi:hypothetical protein
MSTNNLKYQCRQWHPFPAILIAVLYLFAFTAMILLRWNTLHWGTGYSGFGIYFLKNSYLYLIIFITFLVLPCRTAVKANNKGIKISLFIFDWPSAFIESKNIISIGLAEPPVFESRIRKFFYNISGLPKSRSVQIKFISKAKGAKTPQPVVTRGLIRCPDPEEALMRLKEIFENTGDISK